MDDFKTGDLLTTAEFAREVDLTPAAVRTAEKAGRIQAMRTPSGQRLFTRAEAARVREANARRLRGRVA